jgi:hypothetical protein
MMTVMTTEEMLSLPEDGVDRELIRGKLREEPATLHNPSHGWIEARLAHLLSMWLQQQPRPTGEIYTRGVGCRLRRNPDTTVGIDVACVFAEVVLRQTDAMP